MKDDDMKFYDCQYIVWVNYGSDGWQPQPMACWGDVVDFILDGVTCNQMIITRYAVNIGEPDKDI